MKLNLINCNSKYRKLETLLMKKMYCNNMRETWINIPNLNLKSKLSLN